MLIKSQTAFICVWILTLVTVFLLCFASTHYIETDISNLDANRLARIHNVGVVVVGTSLVLSAFPYDDAMEAIAEKQGVHLQFVRFAKPSARSVNFTLLLDRILAAKPKWVFIHIGPFIALPDKNQTFFQKLLFNSRLFLEDFFYHAILHKHPADFFVETDEDTKLNDVAKFPEDVDRRIFFQNPSLPKAYQAFLMKAHQMGIHVVFLQINRSIESGEGRGVASVQAENQAIELLQKKYHLTIWVFPALPLKDYIDGEHMNKYGRLHFTHWFLQRLKNASMDS